MTPTIEGTMSFQNEDIQRLVILAFGGLAVGKHPVTQLNG